MNEWHAENELEIFSMRKLQCNLIAMNKRRRAEIFFFFDGTLEVSLECPHTQKTEKNTLAQLMRIVVKLGEKKICFE